jgi:hypothetical protein
MEDHPSADTPRRAVTPLPESPLKAYARRSSRSTGS